jgi:hypothetical protein
MVPELRFLKVKCDYLDDQASDWTAGWHQSTGVFVMRPTIIYSAACHVLPSLFIYSTVLGAGEDSPAEIDGNARLRRLPLFGRRRRGHHLTGVYIERLPIPYLMAYHAPFSLFIHFSHPDGGGIQQQLLWIYLVGRLKNHPLKTLRDNMASIGQAIDAAAFVAKAILDNVTHELVESFLSLLYRSYVLTVTLL